MRVFCEHMFNLLFQSYLPSSTSQLVWDAGPLLRVGGCRHQLPVASFCDPAITHNTLFCTAETLQIHRDVYIHLCRSIIAACWCSLYLGLFRSTAGLGLIRACFDCPQVPFRSFFFLIDLCLPGSGIYRQLELDQMRERNNWIIWTGSWSPPVWLSIPNTVHHWSTINILKREGQGDRGRNEMVLNKGRIKRRGEEIQLETARKMWRRERDVG